MEPPAAAQEPRPTQQKAPPKPRAKPLNKAARAALAKAAVSVYFAQVLGPGPCSNFNGFARGFGAAFCWAERGS